MRVDYIISGQGLAGSLLAWELIQLGKKVMIFDNPHPTKASSVAAGLINPIVFRRMTKSWLIDDLVPVLIDSYTNLEKQFNTRLFYSIPIKKVLGEGEANFWLKKRQENRLQIYSRQGIDYFSHAFVRSPHGIGEVLHSGRVDIRELISQIKLYLEKQSFYKPEKVSYEKILLKDEIVSYEGIHADKLIFYEGFNASSNPFFSQIQYRHTKGEVLQIKPDNYRSNFILNKSCFLMPEQQGIYKLGATYQWDDLSDSLTIEKRQELKQKLSAIFSDQYEIVGHETGIRPTTHDRRPVIGMHPKFQQLAIFNGLGSKGAMLAPYFARQLANHLCFNSPLHTEVLVDRYF